jgi:hypothetical protein
MQTPDKAGQEDAMAAVWAILGVFIVVAALNLLEFGRLD